MNPIVQTVLIVVAAIAGPVLLFLVTLLIRSLFYDRHGGRNRPNAYYSENTVTIAKPVGDVYSFIRFRHAEIYADYAEGHQTFEITNAKNLEPGAIIHCTETAGTDFTEHWYHVTVAEENRLIAYDSRPTKVFQLKSGKKKPIVECRTWVFYDFHEIDQKTSGLTQTIVVEMPNPIVKFITDLIARSNSGDVWGDHFKEELSGLKGVIENSLPAETK